MTGTFQSLEEARTWFAEDRFATENGMYIEVLDDTHAVCAMDITGRHSNANGGVMGGAIFTLGDFAFAVFVNHKHRPTVAQQVSINYFSQPKGKKLIATAHGKKDGKTTCVCIVDITDDTGLDVAQFIGTGYKLPPAVTVSSEEGR